MKRSRHNKVIGLAIGEQSLLAAEVVGGGRPETRKLTEFVYPDGVTLQQSDALGKALGEFLAESGFTAKSAVVGIPAKWLVVKGKEIPPADRATVSDMLRLQAEGEFSSELKNLVYDYAGEPSTESAGSVLLMATPQASISSIETLCEAARLNLLSVTSTALALGEATEDGGVQHAVVLAVGASGSELTARRAGVPVGVRHMRGSAGGQQFLGELRRAVSSLNLNGVNREMVVWDDQQVDPKSLEDLLNLTVRRGKLADLGVDSREAPALADTGKYAATVALALTVLRDKEPAVDFLHSRLAPIKTARVPRWAVLVGLVLLALIGAGVFAYTDLQQQEAALSDLQYKVRGMESQVKSSEAFVSQVSFAQDWHSKDTRYLNCLRDLTAAFPDDGQTYATNFSIKEAVQSVSGKTITTGALAGQLFGKTSDQQRVQSVLERINHTPGFKDVKSGGTQEVGRAREVSFSVTFVYDPAEAKRSAGK